MKITRHTFYSIERSRATPITQRQKCWEFGHMEAMKQNGLSKPPSAFGRMLRLKYTTGKPAGYMSTILGVRQYGGGVHKLYKFGLLFSKVAIFKSCSERTSTSAFDQML